jgi:hypothetical protein
MKRLATALAVILAAVWLGGSFADEAQVDKHIEGLKSKDPAIRAKAAYDLGCG